MGIILEKGDLCVIKPNIRINNPTNDKNLFLDAKEQEVTASFQAWVTVSPNNDRNDNVVYEPTVVGVFYVEDDNYFVSAYLKDISIKIEENNAE